MTEETKDDGGPVFPWGGDIRGGMTLRDWFAGQALAMMIGPPDYSRGPCNAMIAERAYLIADNLLRARALQSEEPEE